MHRVRALVTLAALLPIAGVASAQPVDPYAADAPRTPPAAPMPAAPATPAVPVTPAAPAMPAAPAVQDAAMADRVAQALVARAQELLDGKVYLDAKQLAVESLVRSPKGPSADQARAIIHAVNVQLGIPEDAPKPVPVPAKPKGDPRDDIDTAPIQDPTQPTGPVPPAEGALPSARLAAVVHGGLAAGLLGATVGAFFSRDTPAKGAVPMGLAVGLAGGLVLPKVIDKLGWSEAQVRTIGAATVWGGAVGGLIGDIAKTDGTTPREVLVSASVGAAIAGVGGYALTQRAPLTRGDVALIDTLAGIGGVGGLTIGMLMQPAESEAYSLNAMFGIAGGVAVGLFAAPQTNTTPRRMLRVAALAAAGGGAPFLLYAAIHDRSSTADERITGLLSSAGLLAGAYLGFRFTAGMDDGLDTLDGKPKKEVVDDAPLALVGRSSDGRWGLGGIGIQPLSTRLSSQPGMAFQVVGAAF